MSLTHIGPKNEYSVTLGTMPRGPCNCRRLDLDKDSSDLLQWLDDVKKEMPPDSSTKKWIYGQDPHFLILMLDAGDYLAKDASGCCGYLDGLPVSDQLYFDTARWGSDYGDIGDALFGHEILPECDRNFPTDWFNRRGDALVARLRDELGAHWTIELSPLMHWSQFA